MKLQIAATAILAAFALPTHASAAVLDWNFQDHLGLLGNTQTFSASGDNLTARGFTLGDTGTALFGKSAGGDENGLGLHNDPSGDNEIASGQGFIQLNLDGLLGLVGSFSIQMGSTTQNEGWQVFGSEDAHPFQFTLLASSTDAGGQEGFHTLPGGWDNYNIFYNGAVAGQCGAGCNANVLIENLDAVTLAATPLPAALPIFASGLLGLGALLTRSKRKKTNRLPAEAFNA